LRRRKVRIPEPPIATLDELWTEYSARFRRDAAIADMELLKFVFYSAACGYTNSAGGPLATPPPDRLWIRRFWRHTPPIMRNAFAWTAECDATSVWAMERIAQLCSPHESEARRRNVFRPSLPQGYVDWIHALRAEWLTFLESPIVANLARTYLFDGQVDVVVSKGTPPLSRGEYRIDDRGVSSEAVVACPACGRSLKLLDREIDWNGHVLRRLICSLAVFVDSVEACRFSGFARLDGCRAEQLSAQERGHETARATMSESDLL
jgi:hypothetical protein